MTPLSLFLVIVMLCPSRERAESVVISSESEQLEYYLCGEGRQTIREGTVLLLTTNITHYVGSGSVCVVQNLTNVTISSDTPGTRAEIVCNHTSEFSFFTNRGFACLNCINLTLSDLSFSQCGGVLSREALLYENSTKVPAYYGTNQSAVWLFSETLDLGLINITITDYYGFAVIAANSYGSPLFQSLHIFNSLGGAFCSRLPSHTRGNYTCYGSGVLVYIHDSNVTPLHNHSSNSILSCLNISNSVFQHNTYFNDDYLCMHSVFRFNPDRIPLVAAGALTTIFTQTAFRYQTVIDHCTITENNGTTTGGLFATFINSPHTSSLLITGQTTLSNNTNLVRFCPGFGMSSYIYFTTDYIRSFVYSQSYQRTEWTPISVQDTLITSHALGGRSKTSSTVYIVMVSQPLFDIIIELERVNFTHNHAFYSGICLYAETSYGLIGNAKPLNLRITDVIVEDNSQYFGNITVNTVTNSSHFLFTRLGRVTIEGTSSIGSSFNNNYGSVINAYASDIYLSGDITFRNNSATQGAALLLRSNSHLILAENSTILFQNNRAFLDGGAIHADEAGTDNYICVLQVDSDEKRWYNVNLNVTFDNNIAYRSGHSIFAAPIQQCFQVSVRVFTRYLTRLYNRIFTFKENTTSALTSPAVSICPCVNNTPDCAKEFPTLSVYPGDSITVSLIGIDSTGGSVFSQLNASFSKTDSTVLPLPGWWIKSEEEISTLFDEQCRNLTYTVYSKYEQGIGRLNFAVPGLPPLAHQNVSLRACPPGFVLNEDNGMCKCSSFLDTIDIKCDYINKILTPRMLNWIGVMDNGMASNLQIGFAPFCPQSYCNSSAKLQLSVINGSICLNNRTGVLCGSCSEGHSISLGPHVCLVCSNYWLFTIIIYLGGGIVGVLLLFLLNLTLHWGTIGGIIFYANLLFIVASLIRSESFLIPFVTPFFFLNLDQAFPSCLYDGMTMSVKLGLRFAYSLYLWMIVAVVIIIARCSSRASKVLMQSSVQVLMTLIHLSFSNMLITVIEVFSSVTVITEDSEQLVWLADGSVEYGQTIGHVILLCVAAVVAAFVILPYLLVGTLGSFGLRYRWVNKLRPFIDAIHGPYKDNRRYWFGVRLVLLVVVYVTYAILRGRFPHQQLLLTLLLLTSFTIVQAAIRPFERDLVGILDTWVMFNAIILVSVSIFSALGGENAAFLLLVNLIIMLCTVAAVVIGHIVLIVKRMRNKRRANSSTKVHDKAARTNSASTTFSVLSSSENDYSRSNKTMHSTAELTFDDGSCKLREPLLEM